MSKWRKTTLLAWRRLVLDHPRSPGRPRPSGTRPAGVPPRRCRSATPRCSPSKGRAPRCRPGGGRLVVERAHGPAGARDRQGLRRPAHHGHSSALQGRAERDPSPLQQGTGLPGCVQNRLVPIERRGRPVPRALGRTPKPGGPPDAGRRRCPARPRSGVVHLLRSCCFIHDLGCTAAVENFGHSARNGSVASTRQPRAPLKQPGRQAAGHGDPGPVREPVSRFQVVRRPNRDSRAGCVLARRLSLPRAVRRSP